LHEFGPSADEYLLPSGVCEDGKVSAFLGIESGRSIFRVKSICDIEPKHLIEGQHFGLNDGVRVFQKITFSVNCAERGPPGA